MRIKKILNNNVVVTDDEKGCEVVVMGKGVAFGKRNGDVVDEGKIGKVYHLGDHEMLEKDLDTVLNETIYISLTDHIHMAIHRLREGIPLRNMMLWEIRRLPQAGMQI